MITNLSNPKRLIPIIILIVSAIWIVINRVDQDTHYLNSQFAPFTGFESPNFQVTDVHGKSVALSDFKGQPVLLNFWASWCSPCRAEMPTMERIYLEYKDQGFEILALNTTHQDSKQKAIAFAEEFGLPFPILFDETGSTSKLYHLQALPSSFFIDKNGIIQEVVIGGPMSEALLRIRVQNLLEGK